MLASAAKQYEEQLLITARAVSEVRRISTRGARVAARKITIYQAESIAVSIQSAPLVLQEQGISSASTGTVAAGSLITSSATLTSMLEQAATDAAFDRIVTALVNDAGRTAALADSGTRQAVTGYVRSLLPPSCSRCAILAGRVYRYSTGFLRHPQCDCLMTPTDQTVGPSLVLDPMEAFDKGWIRGLSKADSEAVRNGADLGRVVNVRRHRAGLSIGSSVARRRGRLTPEGCAIFASDIEDFRRLLRKYGYIL